MKRRKFITLLGGAVAVWPLAARAQQGERMRRIGVLITTAADDPEGQGRVAAFLQGLQQWGWAVGGNVQIDLRFSADDAVIRKHASACPHIDRSPDEEVRSSIARKSPCGAAPPSNVMNSRRIMSDMGACSPALCERRPWLYGWFAAHSEYHGADGRSLGNT